jgi:hypothetical protein
VLTGLGVDGSDTLTGNPCNWPGVTCDAHGAVTTLDFHIETQGSDDPVARDLQSYWPLDGSYDDVAGNRNGVSEGSGNSFVTGKAGQALAMTGNGGVNLGTDYLGATFTFAIWVKVRAGATSWRTAFGQWHTNYLLLGKSEGNEFGDHGGADTVGNPAGGYQEEQWVHLTSVRAGGRAALYVDGVLASEGSGTPAASAGNPVYLGYKVDAQGFHNAWVGELDEAAYWSRGLTDAEVLQVYHAGVNGQGLLSGGCTPVELNIATTAQSNPACTDSKLNAVTSWCSTDGSDEPMDIDLGAVMSVSGVVTQGRGNSGQWVTGYTVQTSTNGGSWTSGIEFDGNSDQNTKVTRAIPVVQARFVRIEPVSNYGWPSMRAAVLACKEGYANYAAHLYHYCSDNWDTYLWDNRITGKTKSECAALCAAAGSSCPVHPWGRG